MSEETNMNTLSDAEIEQLMKTRVKFIKDQLPALRLEDEFHRLTANIAENKLRERMSKMKFASLIPIKKTEEDLEESEEEKDLPIDEKKES
jgi:hypothetical protein